MYNEIPSHVIYCFTYIDVINKNLGLFLFRFFISFIMISAFIVEKENFSLPLPLTVSFIMHLLMISFTGSSFAVSEFPLPLNYSLSWPLQGHLILYYHFQ